MRKYLSSLFMLYRFSVFALGSTAYPNFCAFGKYIDCMMSDLGAERIHEMAEGDELCGQEQAFNDWSKKAFKVGS
jgi:sulfite reductase alpha subunit-like flavoprotein